MGPGSPQQAGSPSDPSEAGMWGQQARASSLRGSWGRGKGRDQRGGGVRVCGGDGVGRNGLERKGRGQRPEKGRKLGVETV